MKEILEACAAACAVADPKDKDPYVKVEGGKAWLVAGKAALVFKGIDQELLFSAPLKLLLRAVKTKDDPIIKGYNTGNQASPISIRSGRSTVKVPSKSVDSYPFTTDYYQALESRFKNGISIPGEFIHSTLIQAESGLEPSQAELAYSQVIWLTVSDKQVMAISGTADRVIKTPIIAAPELGGIEFSINIPRIYIPILDHLVREDFGMYQFSVDNPADPRYAKATFAKVEVYIDLHIQMDEAMQTRIGFVLSIVEMWGQIKDAGQFYPVPEGFKDALNYASGLAGESLILEPTKGALIVSQPKAVSTEINIPLPFEGENYPAFRIDARKLAGTPGDYFFFYEEEDSNNVSLGVRRLVFTTDKESVENALVHFVMVNPLQSNALPQPEKEELEDLPFDAD